MARAAEGTPYVVSRTEQGFDVSLDVVDARWYALLNKSGLNKVYIHHVAVPGDGTYSVTDDAREVEWVAGVPQLKGSATRVYGRVKEFGVQKAWGLREDGTFGKVYDFRFNSEEGRELITGVADQLGLEQRRGTAEKTGLVFALVGGVGALVVVVVLVVAALAGKF